MSRLTATTDVVAERPKEHAIIFLWQKAETSEPMLYQCWERIESEGSVPHLFYDGHISTFEEFRDFLLNDRTMPFVILKDHDPMGMFWLNSFCDRGARIHFVGFRKYLGRKRNAPHFGEKCIRYSLTLADERGYLIDRVIGITPVTNRLAVRYNERAGMVKIGIIPKRCHMAYQGGEVVDAVLTIGSREIYGIPDGTQEPALWYE